MYELIKVSDKAGYFQCPAKIGIIWTDDNTVCLIDSGNDKSAGKKINKILEAEGLKLLNIYNTHSHADHIGGNQYLQKQTGCGLYAPEMEWYFSKHTVLEPSYLYGANPPKELRHKFLMAPESDVRLLKPEHLVSGLELIELPGHSFNMVGFRTPENIVYLADALSGKETLDKYKVAFLVDVESYLNTLEKIKEMDAAMFIPSHADPTENIRELAQLNIDTVQEVAQVITDICIQPSGFESILQKLFNHFNLSLNFEQYALVGSTVRSYLTWLKDKGLIDVEFDDNRLLYRKQ